MDVDQGATPGSAPRLPEALVRRLADLRSNPHLVDASTTPLRVPG